MDIKVSKDKYKINGNSYDRVTTVIGYLWQPELVDWKIRVGKAEAAKESKTSKATGTRVHNLIHRLFTKGQYHFSPHDTQAIKNCMRGYEAWIATEKPRVIEMENTRYCDHCGIAGTRDMDLADTIVDIKTSNSIRLSYWVQLAAYNHLAHNAFKNIAILRLDKVLGIYEYIKVPYDPRLFSIFLSHLELYRYYKPKKGDKNGGIDIANGKVEKRFEVFGPEIRDDWTGRYWEI